jgi:preprotein translocase subunit Sec63
LTTTKVSGNHPSLEMPSAQKGRKEDKKEINNKKFYELLGVDQKAPEADIKRAFKKLAIKKHPDKGGDPEEVRASVT